MPRTHTHTTYAFDELDEDAQAIAVDAIVSKLSEWWDAFDNDSVGESIVYGLAESLRSPGWDIYGESDFPGIGQLSVNGWDIGRSWTLEATGSFSREDAPALPWPNDAETIGLGTPGDPWSGSRRYVCDEDGDLLDDDREDVSALLQALSEAIDDALRAGRDQCEYLTSEDRAREECELHDEWEWNADGTPHNI